MRVPFVASIRGLAALSLITACVDAPTARPELHTAASLEVAPEAALSVQQAPPAPGPTATVAQFRWIEPVGTGGNALGTSTNSLAYLPYLQVDLCEVAAPDAECGPVVARSLATAANGALGLTGDGKAYAASFKARDLALDPARDYRLRVRLVDPAGATVQVGYQNVDVSAGKRGTTRPSFYVTNTKQDIPVKFIVGPGIARSIAVAPSLDTITVGTTRTYSAVVRDWSGAAITGAPVAWLTADPTIAGVSAAGELSALELGRTLLYATSGGLTAAQQVTVRTPVTRVTLVQSPANPVLAGSSVVLTATAYDANANVVTSRPYTWTGVTGSTSSVTWTPANAGSFPVTVSVDGVSASATVVVESPVPSAACARLSLGAAYLMLSAGDHPTTPISANCWDARGLPVEGVPVTWSSSSSGVITVGPTGLLNAVSPGYATIQASAGGRVAKLVAIVTPPGGGIGQTPGSIVVLPPVASIAAGDTVRLIAVVLDGSGNPMNTPDIAWTIGSGAVTIDTPTGQTVLATGVAGSPVEYVNVTARVPAGSGSVTGLSQIQVNTVTQPPAETGGRIVVTPDPINLQAGQVMAVSAVVYDANNHVVSNVPLLWNVGNLDVATILPGGGASQTVTAVAGGITNVTVTTGTISKSVTVTVIALPPVEPPPSSLAVTPATATITQSPSSCVQLTASYTVESVPTSVTTDVTALSGWTLGSGNATVSASGLVCGAGNITDGRNKLVGITAMYNGKSASATITVTP